MPKERRLINDVEDKQDMLKKALEGSFLGVMSILIISYLVFCLADESLLSRTNIFIVYSQGNIMNDVLGLWAVSFTPISSIAVVIPEWVDDIFIYLAPAAVAGLAMASSIRNPKWVLISGIFFILWGILLPLIFILLFPIFGLVDPTSINAGLVSAFSDVYLGFNGFYTALVNLSQSIFLGWCISGTLELAVIATAVGFPLSILLSVIDALLHK